MFCTHTKKTRMHSSRMCTTCSLLYRGGVSLTEIPDRDPPDRDPWTESPQTETSPERDSHGQRSPGQRPPGQRPPWTETPWTETLPWSCDMWCILEQRPPLWTEWHTGVKILPWRNFVAGGNKLKNCITWCRWSHLFEEIEFTFM